MMCRPWQACSAVSLSLRRAAEEALQNEARCLLNLRSASVEKETFPLASAYARVGKKRAATERKTQPFYPPVPRYNTALLLCSAITLT